MFRNCVLIIARVFLNTKITLLNQISGRHYLRNMDCPTLHPPANVRGMKKLNREVFRKIVQIPRLKVLERNSHKVLPHLKKLLLKMERMRPVRPLTQEEQQQNGAFKEVLLHPGAVTGWESLPVMELSKNEVKPSDFSFCDLELSYENWRADEILKCVLPEDDEGLTSYSLVGHIVHVNLRDHLIPFKEVIGAVLKDKVAGCRTVVNKASAIDNTYRNFQIEVICGDEDFQVQTKENGTVFEFDFSKVYWNPRLSTEHERIVKILQRGDVLYDIFAGVGPFSVPAAKKGCTVLANDLNPDSFRWLRHNAKKNKYSDAHITTFNRDGKEFILNEVREDLVRRLKEEAPSYKIHITMNLPSMSTEFLGTFRGLISTDEVNFDRTNINYPLVHLYSFASKKNKRDKDDQTHELLEDEKTEVIVRQLVEQKLGMPLGDNLQSINFVRNVAPNKDMFRVSFYLTKDILTTTPKTQGTCLRRHCEAVDEASVPKIPCISLN